MTAWPVTAQYRPARGRPVLAEWLLPRAATRSGVTIAAAAALTAVAAQIAVPIPGSPVPVTGQTFAVLLTAALITGYGARRGADRKDAR